MDLFQLLVRLVAFGVTLFMLLEFIVVCKVSNIKASLFLLGTFIVVIALFFLFRRYDTTKCDSCGSTLHNVKLVPTLGKK